VIVDFATAAGEHGDALAALLRSEHTISVPVVARASIEHAQRASWILEPTHEGAGTYEARVTARQRAARAQLEELFSARHHRDTLEKLAKGTAQDAPAREALRDARAELKQLRADISSAFGEGTAVAGEPPDWRVEGQELPTLTGASEWFFETMTIGSGVGVYDALSGWTHPTLWGIREHQDARHLIDDGVELSWAVSVDFMERVCATTCSTLYRMTCQLAGYFGWNEARVHDWGQSLNAWCPNLIRD
jgi:hypothetical protein